MQILARLNLNAQAISVANEYADSGVQVDAAPLKAAFAARRPAAGSVKVAMTFPGGTHDLWLRYWLAAGGIDPDNDVETIVVPPPQMVANMKVGTMDVFCVGEPWNAQLVNQGVGYTACNTGEIWTRHRRRALAMRADWVEQQPERGEGDAHGGHGGAAMVRRHGQQGGAVPRSSAGAPGSTCRVADILPRAAGRLRLRRRPGGREQRRI